MMRSIGFLAFVLLFGSSTAKPAADAPSLVDGASLSNSTNFISAQTSDDIPEKQDSFYLKTKVVGLSSAAEDVKRFDGLYLSLAPNLDGTLDPTLVKNVKLAAMAFLHSSASNTTGGIKPNTNKPTEGSAYALRFFTGDDHTEPGLSLDSPIEDSAVANDVVIADGSTDSGLMLDAASGLISKSTDWTGWIAMNGSHVDIQNNTLPQLFYRHGDAAATVRDRVDILLLPVWPGQPERHV